MEGSYTEFDGRSTVVCFEYEPLVCRFRFDLFDVSTTLGKQPRLASKLLYSAVIPPKLVTRI
jgi:hypothetical protein